MRINCPNLVRTSRASTKKYSIFTILFRKKDELIKKLADENESYRRYIENIKRENTNLKNSKLKMENEAATQVGKIDAIEREKTVIV
jgi:phage shock protein A